MSRPRDRSSNMHRRAFITLLGGAAIASPHVADAQAYPSRPIVEKLAKEVIAASKDPAVIEQLTKLGIEPNGTTPEESAAQIAREQAQFDIAIKAANMKEP